MLMCTRKREALVADVQEYANEPMNDQIIRNMFKELDMKRPDLDPNMPPAINPNAPEFGKHLSHLNLVYTAMALKKMKDLDISAAAK